MKTRKQSSRITALLLILTLLFSGSVSFGTETDGSLSTGNDRENAAEAYDEAQEEGVFTEDPVESASGEELDQNISDELQDLEEEESASSDEELAEIRARASQEPPPAVTPISEGKADSISAAAANDLAYSYNKYPVPPFDFRSASSENISPNTGTLYYQETDAVIPGKNGMDLVIGIRYDSSRAESVSIDKLLSLNEGREVSGDKPFNSSNMLNRFAYGWSFQFPSMELSSGTHKNIYFTLRDGRTYLFEDGVGVFFGNNLRDVFVEKRSGEYTWDGASSLYTLTYTDGEKNYFDSRGYLLGIQDRFGNTISFSYTLAGGVNTRVRITDSFGRVITMDRTKLGDDYKSITVVLPDGGEVAYYGGYWLSDKRDQNGYYTSYTHEYAEQVFHENWKPSYAKNKNIIDADIFGAGGNVPGWVMSANLIKIQHPTGAVTEYAYHNDNGSHTHNGNVHRDPTNYQAFNWGDYGYQTYAAVKERKDTASGVVYNHKTYSYGDGKEEHYSGNLRNTGSKNTADTLRSGYTYNTKVTDVSAGILYDYTFDHKHHVTKETRAKGSSVFYTRNMSKYYTVYADRPSSLPGEVTETIGSVSKTENYSYNNAGQTTSYSTSLPGGTAYSEAMTYGDYGLLTGRTYSRDSGVSIAETYTLTGDKKAVADAQVKENGVLKKRSTYVYNADGTLAQANDYTSQSSSVKTTYTYQYQKSGTGAVTSWDLATTTGGYSETNRYDAVGNCISVTDGGGNTTSYTYDKSGRITAAAYPDGGRRTFSYSMAGGGQITATDERSAKTVYQYTPLGQISQVQTAGIITDRFAYDKNMRLVKETDGKGNYSTYTYDHMDRVTDLTSRSSSGAVLYQETYSYQDGVSITDPRTNRAVSAFKTTKTIAGDAASPAIKTVQYTDHAGRLIREGYMNGSTEESNAHTYKYDYRGNLIEERSAYDQSKNTAYTSRYDLDFSGNVLKQTAADGAVASFTYDFLGRQISATSPNGSTSTFTYDDRGLLTEKKTPFEASHFAVRNYRYDGSGSLVQESWNAGKPGGTALTNTVDYTYDSRGNLTKAAYNDAKSPLHVSYTYDKAGNMLTMTTGGEQTTSYAYDTMGRLASVTDPLGQTETYSYDNNSNLVKKVDRNGNIIETAYDGLNRPTAVTAKSSDGAAYPEKTTTSYTKTGTVAKMESESMSVSCTYDSHGRNISQAESGGVVKTYGYDLADRRASFTMTVNGSTALSQSYGYNTAGWLSQVTSGGKTEASYTYDKNGNLTASSYPQAGTGTSYVYGPADQLTSMQNKKGSTVLSEFRYTYYLDGNQASKVDSTGTTSYLYDGLGRLTDEANTAALNRSYSYDAFGNRASLSVSGQENWETSYRYDKNNRLLEELKMDAGGTFGSDYYYDKNGNQTAAASWSLSDAGEGTPAMDLSVMGQENAGAEVQFSTYDAFNRLVGQRQGGMEASYTYGVDGLRLSKTVNGVTTSHIWDGSQIVGERNQSGALASTYIRGNGLIAAGNNSGTPSSYYLYNGHGDVVQLTDNKAAVTKNYTYDAFGNEISMDDSDINPFRYAGEYFDRESGDIYLRARYYSPGTGRFGAEDPIRSGMNWYVYCNNDPLNFVDPSGLDPIPGWAQRINSFAGSEEDYADARSFEAAAKNGAWSGFAKTSVMAAIDQAKNVETVFKYNWTGTHVTSAFKGKVIKISGKLGIEPDDLMAVMAFESRFNPAQGNLAGGSAMGLIQFTSSSAGKLGTTREALSKMSAVEQLDYVYDFLSPYKGRMKNLGDVYMAVLWPGAIGKSNDHTLWTKDGDYATQYNANSGLDVNNDGKITRGEALQKVIDRRNEYGKKK